MANRYPGEHNASSMDDRNGPAPGKPASKPRSRLAFAGTAIAVMIGAPALAGFLARWGHLFELASHFRAQYAIGLLIGTALLIAARRFRIALVTALLLAVHGSLLWPFYRPAGPVRSVARDLRIVTLNIHSVNRQEAAVLGFVRETAPDVAVFLEVSEHWGRVLSALEEDWPYSLTESRHGNFGIAIFSRLPLGNPRIESLSEGCPTILATVERNGRSVTICGAHPYPPMSPGTAESRDRQLRKLAELVAAEPGDRIVVGDFNSTSWSPAFADLAARTGLIDSRLGLGVQPTWPTFLPGLLRIPIDHCLVSPGIAVIDRRTGPDVGSDHLPVIVDVTVP